MQKFFARKSGLFIALLASCAWAAEIHMSGNPPLPVPNVLTNPDMEQGQDNQPTGWRFSTARPDIFEYGWKPEGRSGKCLWLKAHSGEMSGYWSQSFPVQPGRRYLLKGYFRLLAGKILIYAHSSVKLPDGQERAVDERFYRGTARGHWLVPVFLPPEALGGPDPLTWQSFRLLVSIPEPLSALTLSLGLYFQAGEAYFDDLWAGPAETDLTLSVKAAPDETLQKIIVTRKESSQPVFVSPALPAEAKAFETLLKSQPTDDVYTVAVTLADGRTIQKQYPEEIREKP